MEKSIKFWLVPLKEMITSSPSAAFATQLQIQTLFSCMETILNFNRQFLGRLQKRRSEWPNNSRIGDVFLEYAPMMKLYVEYVNNFDHSISTYQELMKDPKKGKKFSDWTLQQQTVAQSNVNLDALLITPVQRCPRYELLLRDLIKTTAPEHEDFHNLQAARDAVMELNQYINSKKKESETRMKLLSIQDKIYSPAPLLIVKPARLYVKDGHVEFQTDGTAESGHLFVMNDLIIICKNVAKATKEGPAGLHLYQSLKLSNLVVVSATPTSFQLLQQQKTWTFTVASPEACKVWVTQIHETLETFALNEMLDEELTEQTAEEGGFVVINSIFGILKNEKKCKDVTQIIQDVVKQQGGKSLFLKEGPKKALFGNPAEGRKKQLIVVYSVNGEIFRKTFNEDEKVVIP
jgi:hypothetical protein